MSKRIIAFTGAGISKDSEIPTFEDMGSLRTQLSREFATNHPKEYRKIIKKMKNYVTKAQPNDAHFSLAEYNVPIITMNIDGLHTLARSKNIIELHGELPNNELEYCDELFNKPVLYGDLAPNYSKAFSLLSTLKEGDTLLIIGASNYSSIANQIRNFAMSNNINVVEIQSNASNNVRKFLDEFFNDNIDEN